MNVVVEEKKPPKKEKSAVPTKGNDSVDRSKPVSKTIINFWLDASLMLVFCALLWVMTVIRFIFPPVGESEGWSLWGASLDQWISIQFGLACFLTMGILLHVMLHWTWVCGVISNRLMKPGKDGKKRSFDDGTRTIIGVGLMIILLNVMGLAMAAAKMMVINPF